MSDEEFIYPTVRARLAFVAIVLFVGLWWLVDKPTTSWYFNVLANQKSLVVLKISAVGFALGAFGMNAAIGLWAVNIGAKIHREKRWPPSGFPVIVRTKVKRGDLIVAQRVAVYFVAALFGAMACFSAYGIWFALAI